MASIAHETGHITGGHLARFRSQLKKAQSASLMLQILSIAAMVGGAATGSNIGQAGGAALQGGNTIIQRSILAYRRVEESSADRAAVSFLNGTRQSTLGMLKTFEYFADQGLASARLVDPYLQSHPMPRQRLAQLRDLARRSPYFNKLDSPSLQSRHEMVKAKLIGFLDNPQTVFNQYPRQNKRYACPLCESDCILSSLRLEGFLAKN